MSSVSTPTPPRNSGSFTNNFNPEFGLYYGPNYANADMVLLKNVRFSERFRMQIRPEFFNLFNHPQFRQPGNVIENPGTFGLPAQTLTRPDGTTSARQIQLALKLNF